MTVFANLALVEKDCAIQIEEGRPIVASGDIDLDSVLYFCLLFRRMGVARLFLMGHPKAFFHTLQMSGQAFLAFLQAKGDEEKCTGKSAPWFDAVAGGNLDLAAQIARVSRRSFHDGEEYEVDFLYHQFLMSLVSDGATDQALEPLLERYDALLEGDENRRMEICQALCQRDSERFNEALSALMEEERQHLAERQSKDQLDPDVAVTTAKLSVEGLALAAAADGRGLTTRRDYTLVPSIARHWGKNMAIPPDSWLR